MSVLTDEIHVFAVTYKVPAPVAMMLPGVFSRGAKDLGMPVRKLVGLATYINEDLGNYLVGAAEECAASEMGKECWANFKEKENG